MRSSYAGSVQRATQPREDLVGRLRHHLAEPRCGRYTERNRQRTIYRRNNTMLNLFDLTGKVALVTGGNGGIGLGIARGLAQAGAKVSIVGRNAEKSQTAARALAGETGVE